MQTQTVTYTTELANDDQLNNLIHDILGYYRKNDCDGLDLSFLAMSIINPRDLLEQWDEHLHNECEEEDEELSLEQLVKKMSPELVPLFLKLKECETQDIHILF